MNHRTKKKIKHIIENEEHEKLCSIVEALIMAYGEEIEEYFDCHIKSKEFYDEAVSYLCNTDGSKGAHWTVEAIEKNVSFDFEKKEYTLLDYCFAVNMIFSDSGDLMTTENIFKSAKRYLEDNDYPGDASERAYKSAKKRIEYFEDDKE